MIPYVKQTQNMLQYFIFFFCVGCLRANSFDNAGLDILPKILERLESLEIGLRQEKRENSELKTLVNELQTEVALLRAENKRLTDRVTDLESRDRKNDSPQGNAEHRKISGNQQAREVEYVLTAADLRRVQRQENEVKVAFFATLSNHLFHLGVLQNIVFDQVITNQGNAYNNHAGDFRAPVAGTYVFSVTLMAYASHTNHYGIYKNGTNVGSMYLRGRESPYASTSMTAVLELAKGEDVSIKNKDQDETLHGSAYSTFSGFLLTQDFSAAVVVG